MGTLATYAADLLTDAAAILVAGGKVAPTVQYIVAGDVALPGCDALIVSVGGIGMGLIGGDDDNTLGHCYVPQNALLQVWLVRCVTVLDEEGNDPPAATITSESTSIIDEGLILTRGIVGDLADASLFGGCRSAQVTLSAPIGPEGGMGGWTVALAVDL